MAFVGYDPSNEPVHAVRLHIGDVTEPFLLEDIEIAFALEQTSNTFSAAAICARALAARYARRVDGKFETIESKDSQIARNYELLARQLDQQAKTWGGLGLPVAGGISTADAETVNADTDRVKPFFVDNMFNNPPPSND